MLSQAAQITAVSEFSKLEKTSLCTGSADTSFEEILSFSLHRSSSVSQSPDNLDC